MHDAMLQFLTDFSYLAMFALIMIENLFPPIPAEVILTFGGFLIAQMHLSFSAMLICSTLGAVVGAIALYWIGTLISVDRLEHWLNHKWVKRLGFKPGDIQKTFGWFEKYEAKAVLIGRCIPVVRSLISIPAGMNRMPFMQFVIYTVVGSAVWNTILLLIGRFAGASWEHAGAVFYDGAKIVAGIALVAFVIYKFVIKRKKDAE